VYYRTEVRPIAVPLTVGSRYAVLSLHDRRGLKAYAKIDIRDWERCKHYRWYRHPLNYAAANTGRNGRGFTCMLSKFIFYDVSALTNYPEDVPELMFRNGDGLDCRRQNLVRCDRSELNRRSNSKRYAGRKLPTGVRFKPGKRARPYQALIRIGGRETSLGCYATPEAAGAKYGRALKAIGRKKW
jgi:hypothetical protein